jgi:hypothetical protein
MAHLNPWPWGTPDSPTTTQAPLLCGPTDSSLPLWSSPTTGAWKRSLESYAHVPGPWSGHYPPPPPPCTQAQLSSPVVTSATEKKDKGSQECVVYTYDSSYSGG